MSPQLLRTAHQHFLNALKEPAIPQEKKKLARLLRAPLPEPLATDLFSYDAFVRGVIKLGLSASCLVVTIPDQSNFIILPPRCRITRRTLPPPFPPQPLLQPFPLRPAPRRFNLPFPGHAHRPSQDLLRGRTNRHVREPRNGRKVEEERVARVGD